MKATHAYLSAALAGLLAGCVTGVPARADEPPPAPGAAPQPEKPKNEEPGSIPAGESKPPQAEAAPAKPDPPEKNGDAPKKKTAKEGKDAAPPAKDSRDQEIQDLKRVIDDLRKRVEDLEKNKTPPPAQPEAPAPETPAPTTEPAGGGRASATLIPNISAIGNIQFRGGDTGRTPNRGRFNFDEFEIAFQDAVSPGLRYDVFLSASKGENWKLGMEEGYLTAGRLGKGLTARLGRIRTPFGKVNPTHPHSRVYIDQPAVMTAFLGPDGLISDGAVVEYLLPFKKLFARAELGRWETTSDLQDGMGFNGGRNGAWSGRVYFGKEVGRDKELELGFSRYSGRGEIPTEMGSNRALAVNGVDLTYRSFPSSYRRYLLQAELMSHDTGNEFAGSRTRVGGYLLAAYRWSQFWEAGARADYTQYPFPIGGHELSGHLFLTKFLTEQTSLRLQLSHGSSPGFSDYNQILFQVLFGSGPHTHPLQ
jgi:hypothetical protein